MMRVRHPLAEYELPDAVAIRKKLGERVRRLREQFNMSQTELAESLGKQTPAYISLIESGHRNLTAAELIRIARHFKVNLSTFDE